MDLAAVKLLLEAQDKTFKSALDIVVEQLKSRIQLAEGALSEVTKSLEFTQDQVKDLITEVATLKKSDAENKKAIVNLKQQVVELE